MIQMAEMQSQRHQEGKKCKCQTNIYLQTRFSFCTMCPKGSVETIWTPSSDLIEVSLMSESFQVGMLLLSSFLIPSQVPWQKTLFMVIRLDRLNLYVLLLQNKDLKVTVLYTNCKTHDNNSNERRKQKERKWEQRKEQHKVMQCTKCSFLIIRHHQHFPLACVWLKQRLLSSIIALVEMQKQQQQIPNSFPQKQ